MYVFQCIHVKTSKDVFPACIFLYFVVTKDYHECKKMKVSRYRRFISVKRIKLKVHCDKITGNV